MVGEGSTSESLESVSTPRYMGLFVKGSAESPEKEVTSDLSGHTIAGAQLVSTALKIYQG